MARDMAGITKVPGKRGNSYRVQVWDARAGKLHRKTFRVLAEARTWRDDARIAVKNGTVRAASRTTVREAAQALLVGIGDGTILDRSGDAYKPSTVRSYRQAVNGYLADDPLAAMTLTDVRRSDVQHYVERLRGKGLQPSTVANKLDPVRVLFRRALENDEIAVDPTAGLKLPAVRGRRDRVATRQEAAALIEALPVTERALWATAFYAGLRRGELRGLRWSDVDLAAEPAVIHVRRTWDDEEGEVATKTDAGFRTVPMTTRLRELVVAHGLDTRRGGDDLVFGRTASSPFVPSTVRARARKAWKGLNVITPHEARHSAASYLIEAGLNDLELTVTIGHSDARTTKRIYGHLFSDSGATIAAKLDAYHGTLEASA
jgi:integrase